MVGEHLGVIFGAAERLDPGGRAAVPLAAGRARDLTVGDVAEQDVPEGVLGLARDRGAARLLHELLPLEPEEQLLGLLA